MNSATSTLKLNDIIPPDFIQKAMAEADAIAVNALRPMFAQAEQALWHYALPILLTVAILLLIALVKAVSGSWGMLGSLLYHIFYFTIFGLILWVRGPELLLNGYFDLVCVVLNPICYWLSGLFLEMFRHPHGAAFL